jgi:hypothetical protein
MKRTLGLPLVLIACVLCLLVLGGVGVAQELNVYWVVGKWQGVATGATSRGRFEINVKGDGTYEGGTKGAIGDIKDGRWKIDGNTMTLQHIIDPPPGRGPASKVTWTLQRKGENLEGSAFREIDNARYSVKMTKAQ